MIDLYKIYLPADLKIEEVKEILFSGKLNSGNYVKTFEKHLQNFTANPFLFVTANYNYASLIALASIGLKNEDEVIASPIACLASNMPVLNFGARIRWADIDPLTGSLDPSSVRKKINSKTKAIIHYHWGGYPGYIDEINQVGKEFGIYVIDDAIESFGSAYNTKHLGGTESDITLFSFQTIRLPNSIDGGAISFKSKELFEKATLMRDYGINRSTFRDSLGEISPDSDVPYPGYYAIMNEVNAFIGATVFKDTGRLIEKQRQNALNWNKVSSRKGWLPLNRRKNITPNYWIYSFLSENRDEDMIDLRKNGFYASKVHLRNDLYSCFGGKDHSLKGVREFEIKQLSVPSGWWVTSNNFSEYELN